MYKNKKFLKKFERFYHIIKSRNFKKKSKCPKILNFWENWKTEKIGKFKKPVKIEEKLKKLKKIGKINRAKKLHQSKKLKQLKKSKLFIDCNKLKTWML